MILYIRVLCGQPCITRPLINENILHFHWSFYVLVFISLAGGAILITCETSLNKAATCVATSCYSYADEKDSRGNLPNEDIVGKTIPVSAGFLRHSSWIEDSALQHREAWLIILSNGGKLIRKQGGSLTHWQLWRIVSHCTYSMEYR